jgi:hypothetical protein
MTKEEKGSGIQQRGVRGITIDQQQLVQYFGGQYDLSMARIAVNPHGVEYCSVQLGCPTNSPIDFT